MTGQLMPALAPGEELFHLSFYRFVALENVPYLVEVLNALCCSLLGRIVIASEGINGMLAGGAIHLDQFESAMNSHPALADAFRGLNFKRTACSRMPFHRMKVHQKAEILHLGIAEHVDAVRQTGFSLSPHQWREWLRRDDVVVIDNRNSFEYRLGRFTNAIDPQVNNFREFHQYIEAQLPQWRAEDKKLAMYCTGGIRCEKTSAWLKQLGIESYQLEGGILNYLKQIIEAHKEWEGECFVFDKRIALDTQLKETRRKAQEVYSSDHPQEAWRLRRALRLERNDLPIDDSSVFLS
jgi:UPF0176 protein